MNKIYKDAIKRGKQKLDQTERVRQQALAAAEKRAREYKEKILRELRTVWAKKTLPKLIEEAVIARQKRIPLDSDWQAIVCEELGFTVDEQWIEGNNGYPGGYEPAYRMYYLVIPEN